MASKGQVSSPDRFNLPTPLKGDSDITKKISDLNCKLDTVCMLSEPRENSYIEYRLSCSSDDTGDHHAAVVDPVLGGIAANLAQLGSIKVTNSLPTPHSLSQCRLERDPI